MSLIAAIIIVGALGFAAWVVTHLIIVSFPPKLPEPKPDERSSIEQFNRIMSKDWK